MALDNDSAISRFVININPATSPQRRLQSFTQDNSGTVSKQWVYEGSIITNTWQHAAATWNSSNDATNVYYNALAGTLSVNNASVTPTGINSIFIGATRSADVVAFLDGRVAEAGIWNVELTVQEIESLYKGMTCNQIRPQNLVFYAPLIRNLQDARGALAITNNNTATVTDHPRVY